MAAGFRPEIDVLAPRSNVNAIDLLIGKVAVLKAGSGQLEPRPYAMINMYLGTSVEISCRRGSLLRHGRAVAGDLDIVPARTPCAWDIKQNGLVLVMRMPAELLRAAACKLQMDPHRIELADRFRLRDPQIEHIGWALKSELDAGSPSGALFRESLASALAVRLLQCHGQGSLPPRILRDGMSKVKLQRVLAYVEDNLGCELSIKTLAAVIGVSSSHLKSRFRKSTGLPVHQYVLRRRVAGAQRLLAEAHLSVAEVASSMGFAHGSHLARHVQRILGVAPAMLRGAKGMQPGVDTIAM